jgi:hypothetical protein
MPFENEGTAFVVLPVTAPGAHTSKAPFHTLTIYFTEQERLSSKLIFTKLVTEFLAFMEPGDSLPCLQKES